MQTLSVLAVEDGAIVLASPAGERFRLPIDGDLRARLLGAGRTPDARRLSPREIQAHVRSGLSAEQVAAMTGVAVESIERFVGPVLAERAFVVESALAVRVPSEVEGARSRTFGAVMGERLGTLAARDVRWSSAKEPSGWVLTARFVADEVGHEARWRFDPKHMALEPDNVEASTLSQRGVPAALTPRLRAIEPTAPVPVPPSAAAVRRAPEPGPERFDSAAFRFGDDAPSPPPAPAARATARPDPGAVFAARPAEASTKVAAAVTPLRSRHAEDASVADRPTEPIRRRRERAAEDTGPVSGSRPRRGRTSMPSWDEIVFGRDDA